MCNRLTPKEEEGGDDEFDWVISQEDLEKEQEEDAKWAAEKMKKVETQSSFGSFLSLLLPNLYPSEVVEKKEEDCKGKGKEKEESKEKEKKAGKEEKGGELAWKSDDEEAVCLLVQNILSEKEADTKWITKKVKREVNEKEKTRLLSFFSFLIPGYSPPSSSPSRPSPSPSTTSSSLSSSPATSCPSPCSRKRKTRETRLWEDLDITEVGPKRRRTLSDLPSDPEEQDCPSSSSSSPPSSSSSSPTSSSRISSSFF